MTIPSDLFNIGVVYKGKPESLKEASVEQCAELLVEVIGAELDTVIRYIAFLTMIKGLGETELQEDLSVDFEKV